MSRPIAALYVEANGSYYGLPDIDPWDEARDARRYPGPHPVIAHPPCQRWGKFWAGQPLFIKKTGIRKIKGDDGGCFAAALAAVRQWGGVIEHPWQSHAWAHFGLNTPSRKGGWIAADLLRIENLGRKSLAELIDMFETYRLPAHPTWPSIRQHFHRIPRRPWHPITEPPHLRGRRNDMTMIERVAEAQADAEMWRDVAHRMAGLLDCMMLYCTYPDDSHPRAAMAVLQAVWKPLGFRGQPRMTGQIKPAEDVVPPLPAMINKALEESNGE